MSSERPYIQFYADELWEIARRHWHDPERLLALEKELSRRFTRLSRSVWQRISQRLAELESTGIPFPDDAPFDNPLLMPDEQAEESWLEEGDLPALVAHALQIKPDLNATRLESYSYRCRVEAETKRAYSVPTDGVVELEASQRLRDVLTLEKIRFVQEGIEPPGVYLRFGFGVPGRIGIVRIHPGMVIEGFHYSQSHLGYRALVNATAFGYFRDLVVPASIERRPRARPAGARVAERNRRQMQGERKRALPRTPTATQAGRPDYFQWISAQTGPETPHGVVGHLRWVGERYVAPRERRRLAWREAGIDRLPPGYTYVRAHERLAGQHVVAPAGPPPVQQRTLFRAPRRAADELDSLLE